MTNPDAAPHPDDEAFAALEESRRSTMQSAAIIADARAAFNLVHAHRDADHFIEKYKAILGGIRT